MAVMNSGLMNHYIIIDIFFTKTNQSQIICSVHPKIKYRMVCLVFLLALTQQYLRKLDIFVLTENTVLPTKDKISKTTVQN